MSVRIGMALGMFPFSSPQELWQWVEACEGGDVDSIWQTDRLVSVEPSLEPLSLMAALASSTQRMRFGTNVLVLPLRDPIVVAKQCATIDYLSGGRFVPSFGVGSDTAIEWRATGHDRHTRGARMDEALTVMAQLWTGASVTFAGKHYQYEDVQIAPGPAQQPLPLWIGGSSDAAVRRTARIGTGWLGGGQTVPEVAVTVAAIRDSSAAAGRPLDPDHYGIAFPFRFGGWEDDAVRPAVAALARQGHAGDPGAYLAVGDASTILARVQEFRDSGISKFVLRPIASGGEDFMDQTRRLIDTVIPSVHGH